MIGIPVNNDFLHYLVFWLEFLLLSSSCFNMVRIT